MIVPPGPKSQSTRYFGENFGENFGDTIRNPACQLAPGRVARSVSAGEPFVGRLSYLVQPVEPLYVIRPTDAGDGTRYGPRCANSPRGELANELQSSSRGKLPRLPVDDAVRPAAGRVRPASSAGRVGPSRHGVRMQSEQRRQRRREQKRLAREERRRTLKSEREAQMWAWCEWELLARRRTVPFPAESSRGRRGDAYIAV